jgi:glycine cleavage system H lipoate-binding protein
MRCPYLREAQVKYCDATAPRKMIVRMPDEAPPEQELCSTGEFRRCQAMKEYREELPHRAHCPFLHESLVQYCAAVRQTKYVPYTRHTLQRCGYDNYRYCDIYQARQAETGNGRSERGEEAQIAPSAGGDRMSRVKGITLPAELLYTPNHWWLDPGPSHSAHIGVDGFLARVLGPVSAVEFRTVSGTVRPTIAITLSGTELHLTFPAYFAIRGFNSHLRAHPEKLNREPYTCGWLFEGSLADRTGVEQGGLPAWLGRRDEAERTIACHSDILPALVHRPAMDIPVGLSATDGGAIIDRLAGGLSKAEIQSLYDEMFSPLVQWSRR